MVDIDMSALTDAIAAAGTDNVAAGCLLHNSDAMYHLPTRQQWEPQAGALHAVDFAKLGGYFLAQRIEYARIFA